MGCGLGTLVWDFDFGFGYWSWGLEFGPRISKLEFGLEVGLCFRHLELYFLDSGNGLEIVLIMFFVKLDNGMGMIALMLDIF